MGTNTCMKEANGWLFWITGSGIFASQDGISFFDTGYGSIWGKVTDLAYGNSKYVAVGENGFIISSDGPDAYGNWNWSDESPPGEFTGDYWCVIFAEGYFLAGGGTSSTVASSTPIIHRSLNGASWSTCTVTLDTSTNGVIYDMAAGGGNILAVGSGYDGANYLPLILLSTAPDENFEESAVTLPAQPVVPGYTVDYFQLLTIIYTGDRFITAGDYEAENGIEMMRSLLYQSGTGSIFEDITSRLVYGDDGFDDETRPHATYTPSRATVLQHGSDLFYLHAHGRLEVGRLGASGPDDFRTVPLVAESYAKEYGRGMISFGDNFYFALEVAFRRSDPFVSLPPAV